VKETKPPIRENRQRRNEALTAALQHLQAGRLQQATELCEQVLDEDPNCAEALHLLGVIAGQAGFFEPAVQLLKRCIELQPKAAGYRNDLGVAYRNMNELDPAAECFEEALRIDPEFVDSYYNLGNLCQERGQCDLGAEYYRRAIQLRPSHTGAWNGSGECLLTLGRRDEAIEAFRNAVTHDPNHVDAHRHLGILLRAQGRTEDALRHLRRVVELEPASGEAHNDVGAMLLDMDRTAEAESWFRQALKITPKFPEAWLNLGRALRKLRRATEAESCFRQVVELWPDSVEAQEDLGIALGDQSRMDEAFACFHHALRMAPERAETYYNIGHAMLLESRFAEALEPLQHSVKLKPNFPEAWNNMGGCFLGQGTTHGDDTDLDEAERWYKRAIELKPMYAEAHANLALLHLLRGRFEEGWKEWEWRWRGKENELHRYQRPLWRGEPLEGKTILLHTEGGLGDTLQFVRYAQLLRDRGARVVLQCPKALLAVLSGCSGVDLLVNDAQQIPDFDLHAPLMSVPGIAGTTSASIPADVPYIFADAERTAFWKDQLSSSDGLKVGIAWQGNPEYVGDQRRSVPLSYFEPLAKIPGVRLLSLQTGRGREQLEKVGAEWKINDLGLPLSETAAVMMNLDLIVTSDTAIAHLAGALARPTWLAVCCTPDWRWLLRRADSPWYPTMRLFRQPGLDQWPAVFASMAAQMQTLLDHTVTDPIVPWAF
jgi:tetratricopeptide (TPR) repeat protein